MELYLDSANLQEIETAFKVGFLTGLTTTPTFMHRDGITDVDSTILELARKVPILQVEALGRTTDEIVDEAHRLLDLGLDRTTTVFKIPISMEGATACKRLTDEGLLVNLHLIYTLQQAYIAMTAGATYICPLVGRLQDQGHDALSLVAQCVEAVDHYGYDSKIMFSSVRHPEHVRNALNLGAHAVTVPWKVLQQLPQNHFTALGTSEFFEHTRLMTLKVKDVIRPNPSITKVSKTINEALVEMTRSKLGAVALVDDNGELKGIFTDGDLRRMLEKDGEVVLQQKLENLLSGRLPLTVDANASLLQASELFKQYKVDQLVVIENGKPAGLMDVQDLLG